MDVMTRDDARALGRKKFFSGIPCANGHLAERYVRNGQCIECRKQRYDQEVARDYNMAYRAKNKAALSDYDKAKYQKVAARHREEKGFCLRSSRTSWMRSVSKNSFFCGKWRSKGFGHGGSKTRERSSRFTPSADHQKSAQSLCGLVNSMLLCGTKLLNLQFDERRPPASAGTSTT